MIRELTIAECRHVTGGDGGSEAADHDVSGGDAVDQAPKSGGADAAVQQAAIAAPRGEAPNWGDAGAVNLLVPAIDPGFASLAYRPFEGLGRGI